MKILKLSNVRIGFAANSSSTHSIIFGLKAKDNYENGQFGWDEWCATSKKAKSSYLAQTLYVNLERELGHDIALSVVQEWTGATPDKGGDVDHQSLMCLPYSIETGQVSKEFFDELQNYYLQDNLTIVGGNDNGEHVRFTENRKKHVLPRDERVGSHFCKKDGNYWVLFNKETGCKLRLTFNEKSLPYTKSATPELVDIKITDYCPFNCAYCFQGSTPSGAHADIHDFYSISSTLQKMQVFEVALGGGEPTLHPDFTRILEHFSEKNIVPNFTTFTIKWMNDPSILNAVKEHVGRFALSIDNHQKIADAYALAKCYNIEDKLSFHYVLETQSEYELELILKEIAKIGKTLVLLGYKETRRGKDFKPYRHSNDNWIKLIKEHAKYTKIGIDTAVAQQFRSKIEEDFPQLLVTFEEGKFSMYIDAVRKRIAPSSYCSETQYTEVDYYDEEELITIFQGF